jgi:hypothetical protein
MIDRTEMTERHARILKRLSEFGEALVEPLHADVIAAETPEARTEAVKAFHTLSRSLRQTLALEARFEREQRRVETEARMEAEAVAEREAEARQDERRGQVRSAVTHLIWNEWDLPDHRAESLLRDAETKLEDMDFDLDDPVEAQVRFLARRLGYALEPIQDEGDGGGEAPAPQSPSREPPEPLRFNGRLAPPRDIPDWCDDDST